MTKLAMFNQLKSLAFGLDSLFKATDQTQVKFHQVSAAIFLAVEKKLEEFEQNYLKYHSDTVKIAEEIHTDDLNHAVEFIKYHKRGEKKVVLSKIFGENLHDTLDEELDAMCDFIHDVARGIESARDDRALNNVMNNYHHGNSPITAATYDDILKFIDVTGRWESKLYESLEQYGLNLKAALKAKNNSELFQQIVAQGTWNKFPTCHFDIPEAVEKINHFIEENKKIAHSLQIITDVFDFLIKDENNLPTAYELEKAKKYDYERKLAWFFGWAAHEDHIAILHAERFVWLYQNFPESSQSAFDVAVAFEKKGFLQKLFSMTPIEDRSKFIVKAMKIAAAMNNRSMLLFIHSMMLDEHLSMNSIRCEMMKAHPIDECIRHNHLETLEFLLQLGLPVDVPEGEFSMDLPLAMAARFNRSDCVALLIKYGANVNAKDSTDGTALEDAITHAHWDIAKQLIEAGAENRVDKKGKTILDLIQSEARRLQVESWFNPRTMTSDLPSQNDGMDMADKAYLEETYTELQTYYKNLTTLSEKWKASIHQEQEYVHGSTLSRAHVIIFNLTEEVREGTWEMLESMLKGGSDKLTTSEIDNILDQMNHENALKQTIQALSQECIDLFKSTPVAVRGQAALWIKKINELDDRLLETISTHLETKKEAVLRPV